MSFTIFFHMLIDSNHGSAPESLGYPDDQVIIAVYIYIICLLDM
jgi:hypothetical protein